MSKVYEQVYNQTLTYADIATLNQYISTFRPSETPIHFDLTLLDGADSVKFTDDYIKGNFNLNLRFSDIDGSLITAYTITGLDFRLKV